MPSVSDEAPDPLEGDSDLGQCSFRFPDIRLKSDWLELIDAVYWYPWTRKELCCGKWYPSPEWGTDAGYAAWKAEGGGT